MAVKRAFATAGLSAVETAVVKATFDDDERPKQKHLRTIADYVELELAGTGYDTYATSKNLTLVEMLRKRVTSSSNHTLSWRVVLKTLITMHTLLRESDRAFSEELSQSGRDRVLSVTMRYVDRASSRSQFHSEFQHKYSRYLVEKLEVFAQLGYNVERKVVQRNKDFFKSFDVDELGKILVE